VAGALAGEGEARFDEPMARHTTLRIGGPVDAWVEPSTIAAMQRVRALCATQHWPCRAVGAGSNLLVRDGGIRGVLVSTERLRDLAFDGERVRVGAGVATGKLLSEATRRGLGGVEFLGGVPGSVGGGLIMNAGTYLGEFKDVTTRVRSIDERGALVEREAALCGFVYRGSAIPAGEVVVEGELLLRPRERVAIEADVRALRDRRRAREPHGVANAGSIFKNPEGDYAGRLIEACGLKGRRAGDAEVSPAHANWIVNLGQARAADVLALIDVCRAAVREKFGRDLELEVKVVGEE
jgi:UDP-N-acetylmuramate dehydrogenase